MGCLTTITLHNDAMHAFEKDPEGFAKAIFEACYRAEASWKCESQPFEGYANYIHAQPPYHADNHQLYVHYGNTVLNVNPYSKDFEELCEKMPEVALTFAEVAESMAKNAKKKAKEAIKAKKETA